MSSTTEEHIRLLRLLSIGSWAFTLALVCFASYLLPLFDTSPLTLLPPSPNRSFVGTFLASLLRWDIFHFAHIAKEGYVYEYEWAFLPGAPLITRIGAYLLNLLDSRVDATGWENLLLAGSVAACFCESTTTLYHLTLHHLHSPSLALLVSLLSLFPSSPVTLHLVGYTEPFYTWLSYRGMLSCARAQWFRAACLFALAGLFRSNGVLLSGFIIWGLLIQPIVTKQQVSFSRLLYALALSVIVVLPFVAHNTVAYLLFCVSPHDSQGPSAWCTNFPPSIYTYVQAKYWNSGFLTYWTPAQVPNFIMSAPPLVLLLAFSTVYAKKSLIPQLSSYLSSSSSSAHSAPIDFWNPSLAPYAVHTIFLSLTLLLNAHTQIILRLAAALPVTYWAAAWLFMEKLTWAKLWVSWSILWGCIMCVLWAVFLPPA